MSTPNHPGSNEDPDAHPQNPTPPPGQNLYPGPVFGDHPYDKTADGAPHHEQSPYGHTQYGQPEYGQPQYGQPAYGQPQYGQPAYGQPQYGQPPYGQAPYGQAQFGAPAFGVPENNTLAVVSLVTGILSIPALLLCYLGVPLAIAALITGFIARGQITREPARFRGTGQATAGIICGAISLVLLVLLIVLIVAVGLSSPTNF